MVKTVEVLTTEMAEAYAELTSTINGLTDAECSWEPVDGCWRVFRESDGRWTYDYALPEPRPAPWAACIDVGHDRDAG